MGKEIDVNRLDVFVRSRHHLIGVSLLSSTALPDPAKVEALKSPRFVSLTRQIDSVGWCWFSLSSKMIDCIFSCIQAATASICLVQST